MATWNLMHKRAKRQPPLVIVPLAGSHISQACRDALDLAGKSKREVSFSFNGIQMFVPPKRRITVEGLVKRFNYACRGQAERWRNSAEGLTFARERAEAIARKQEAVTAAIAVLPGLLAMESAQRMDAVVGWLASLVEDADDVGIDWDRAAGVRGGMEWVAVLLESAGFRESDLVGEPEDSFTSRERMGRYIVGQAINCLRIGLPPHPITTKFAGKYFALPAQSE